MLLYRLSAADIPSALLADSMNAHPIQYHLFWYHQDIRDQGNFLLNGSYNKNHSHTCKEDRFGPGKILYR